MAENWPFFSFLALLSAFVISASADRYACRKENPCLCHYDDDEQHLDLTHLLPDDGRFISASKNEYTFYYHGCVDKEFDVDVQNITHTTCTRPLTLCLENRQTKLLTYLGSASASNFQQDKDIPHIQEISYTNGSVTTVVRLICAIEFPETTLVVHSMEKNKNVLDIFSSKACRAKDHTGLSTGSKLIITILVLGTLYFIAGSLLNYYIRGARGKEVIPNIDFWISLPGLVKDGIVFVMNGCNSQMVSTADSYDQI